MTNNAEKFAAKNARMTFDKSGRVSSRATMSSESRSRQPVPDLLHALGWAERFELLDCIGSGAMGQVWRARERDSEKIVALKMLDPARAGDEQTLARLDIEAATLMKLREAGSHANVVPILDFKLTDSQACLVMEFIPGLNLKKWCEAHRLGLRERVRLIAQVARASGWFHALGIVHRDLKPANILVNAVTHQPVIVDFSIAKLDDSLPITLTNEALGTAPYMAPEQIDRRRGGITPATDVYALGATLYELLTQVHPHPGDLTQVVRRHAEEVRPAPLTALNPEVARDLECICLKTLSYRPEDRYADGGALAEDLERFLAGEPVKARPISRLTHLGRQARRKPALTSALAVCVALGGFVLWNYPRQVAQRERFALQTRLTTAMQATVWNPQSLREAEATLAALEEHNAPLAGQVRERLHHDIVRDMESRLQQNHLLDEDFEWLRTTVTWLESRSPAQAGRLRGLITERLGRWETQIELRGPLADLQGVFPRSRVEAKNGLLYPVYEGDNGKIPALVVTETVSVPVEASCTFVGEAEAFHHIAMEVAHENSRVSLALYKAKHAPRAVLDSLRGRPLEPQSHVLFIVHKRDFKHAIHIPDTRLLEQPFRMTLRLEREWAEADINGRWRLRLDSPFALGSVEAKNYFRISWPRNVGLKELIVRARRSDAFSPLEQADLLAAKARWTEARHLYDCMRICVEIRPSAPRPSTKSLNACCGRLAAVMPWPSGND
jgi:predicted Ser/Thr protein kinase